MKLVIVAALVSILWTAVAAAALKAVQKSDRVVRRRLYWSIALASSSIALWVFWSQVRFTIHPLNFPGHWGMVGLCLLGMITAIAAVFIMPKISRSIRIAWICCSLLMIGIFLLTAVVSIPVS